MSVTRYIWDYADGSVNAVAISTQAATTVYTSEPTGLNSLVSEAGPSTTYFGHYDGVLSRTVITDYDSQVISSTAYSAFGTDLTRSASPVQVPFGYLAGAGCITDAHPARVTAGTQSFLPSLGRWETRWPGRAMDTLGTYVFASNRPLSLIQVANLFVHRHMGADVDALAALQAQVISGADSAAKRCAQMAEIVASDPPPNPWTTKTGSSCQQWVEAAILNPPQILAIILQGFKHADWKCPLPPIRCQCCRFPGSLGAYNRFEDRMHICANNVTSAEDVAVVLAHELTHALQDCKGLSGRTNCERSLKWELEAYACSGFCNGPGGSFDFATCLDYALGSSCPNHCEEKDITPAQYSALEKWFEDHRAASVNIPLEYSFDDERIAG